MTTKKRKNEGLKALLFGAAFFLIIGITSNLYRSNIKRNGLYTIGYVYRTEGTRGGVMVYYEYFYKKQKYISTFISANKRAHDIKRYFVQFLANNPKKRTVLDEVPDWIDEAPDGGWTTLPRDWGKKKQ